MRGVNKSVDTDAMKGSLSYSSLFRPACMLLLLALTGCASGVPDAGDRRAIVGSWSALKTSAPHRDQYVFAEDGTLTLYEDYEREEITDLGFWSLDGSLLTMSGIPGIPTEPMPIQWLSNDAFVVLVEGAGTLYRAGTEPEGLVFSLPSTLIHGYGASIDFAILGGSSYVFRFTAMSADDRLSFTRDRESVRASVYTDPGHVCLQEEVDVSDSEFSELSGFQAGQSYLIVVDNGDQGSVKTTRLSLFDGGV